VTDLDVREPAPGVAPDAWRPRGRPFRWALGAIIAVTALCGASLWFGALTPRLGSVVNMWGGDGPEVRIEMTVTNEAHAGVRVTGVGESLPGLALVRTSVTAPVPLGPGDGVVVMLTYRVTDCARIPARPPAIPVRATTVLGLPRTVAGPASVTTDAHGAPVPWAADLTRFACR
jgi:hypothetical protein